MAVHTKAMYSTILDNMQGVWRIIPQSTCESGDPECYKELVFSKITGNQSILGWYSEKKSEGATHNHRQVIPFICRLQAKSSLVIHFQFGKNLFSESYYITALKPGSLYLRRIGETVILKLEKV